MQCYQIFQARVTSASEATVTAVHQQINMAEVTAEATGFILFPGPHLAAPPAHYGSS